MEGILVCLSPIFIRIFFFFTFQKSGAPFPIDGKLHNML